MRTCEHMYVYKEVLSVSSRKGRGIREFAQHGFIYKSIYYTLSVYLGVYEYVNKEVLSVSTCKGTNRFELRNLGSYTRVFVIYSNICILVTICIQTRGSKCEHSQGHRHM